MNTLMVTLLLGLSTLGGIAPAPIVPLPKTSVTNPGDDSVTVQNDRKVPVTVYLEYGVFDRRLGIVPALHTATLALPSWAVNGRETVQLFVHPDGEAGDLASQTFSLAPPARLALLVPAHGSITPSATVRMTAVIPPEELSKATLTVDNPRDRMVTVFSEQGQFDVRLGQVPAHGKVTLLFPASVVGPDNSIQIFVHPDGGFDLSSATMHITRGEHVGLKVPLH
jgi:hypothetical protein